MRFALPVFAVAALLTLPALAQDSTSKTRTKVKADDAKVVSMTGCLRQDPLTNTYTLVGTMAATGDELKTKSKVKTDVDDDDTKVKATTKTKADDNGAVATAGSMTTFSLLPGDVSLSPHVGHQVQVSAIMVEPGHGDADVKIKEKTKVDPEHADDSTARSKTKVELPKSPLGQYTVVSVNPLSGGNCSAY
jgi:hypothetical protein